MYTWYTYLREKKKQLGGLQKVHRGSNLSTKQKRMTYVTRIIKYSNKCASTKF